MHRPTVAVIALLLLTGVVYFWIFRPAAGNELQISFQAACNRLSIVMVALWLAHPQLNRFPGWLLLVVFIVVSVALLAAKPTRLAYILPILLALWLTRSWNTRPPRGVGVSS